MASESTERKTFNTYKAALIKLLGDKALDDATINKVGKACFECFPLGRLACHLLLGEAAYPLIALNLNPTTITWSIQIPTTNQAHTGSRALLLLAKRTFTTVTDVPSNP